MARLHDRRMDRHAWPRAADPLRHDRLAAGLEGSALRKCPAGTDDIVKALARIEWGELTIALVPGLSTQNDGMPDVMRGEETQIFGALALSGSDAGLFLLPGTHSKWAMVSGGRIVSFRTFMTGEVFGALKDHTILGRLMSGSAADADAFTRGVREGASLESAGALLNRVFATRTYGLMEKLASTALPDYLSGLLIGAEVAEATRQTTSAITIIASPALAQRYTDALRQLGYESALAPTDCVAAGHWRIAQAAGSVSRRRDARPARRPCSMPDRRDPARREAGRDRCDRRCAGRGRRYGHRSATEFAASVREHQKARRTPRTPRARRRRHGADGRRCCACEGCGRPTDRRTEFRC